jgi:hypothetical protein
VAAFVLSGVALVAAVWGAKRRPLYVGGYFAWHANGHRPLFFVGPGTHHGGSTLAYLAAHVVAGPVETLAALLGYFLCRP